MAAMIDRVDHLVLTVNDIEATTRFYERVLGFEREFFRAYQLARQGARQGQEVEI